MDEQVNEDRDRFQKVVNLASKLLSASMFYEAGHPGTPSHRTGWVGDVQLTLWRKELEDLREEHRTAHSKRHTGTFLEQLKRAPNWTLGWNKGRLELGVIEDGIGRVFIGPQPMDLTSAEYVNFLTQVDEIVRIKQTTNDQASLQALRDQLGKEGS